MRTRMNLRGRWILVTGASSGLGYAMSHVIARDYGGNLVLAARRNERLVELAELVQSKYGVKAVPLRTDLRNPDEVENLFLRCTSGRSLQAAILNAGVSHFGRHLDIQDDLSNGLLATNVSSVVYLTRRLTQHFVEQAECGGLMLVSSLAGFIPLPYQSLYSACKAFGASYGQALREELRGTSVSITVFAPGGIGTELLEKSGLERKFKKNSLGIMQADRCARIGVKALVRRKALSIPGVLNKSLYAGIRLAPRPLALRIAAMMFQEK